MLSEYIGVGILRYFNYLAIFGITFSVFNVVASVNKRDCLYKTNTICQAIIKLSPDYDKKKAYKLSNHISKVSKKFDLNPLLIVSIAFQESSFRLNTIRKAKGLFFNNVSKKFEKKWVGEDFCMMQINYKNIIDMKLDTNKLLTDIRYCLNTGAKILSKYKKKYSKKDKFWWTRYNAKSPEKREEYLDKINQHLTALENKEEETNPYIAKIEKKEEEVERQLASNQN